MAGVKRGDVVGARLPQLNSSKTRRQPMDLFKHDMGKTDRIVRAVLGVLLIGTVFFALQHPVGWIGVIPLTTAITGICLLDSLLTVNTESTAGKVGWYLLIPLAVSVAIFVGLLLGVFGFAKWEMAGAVEEALRTAASGLGIAGIAIAGIVQLVLAVLIVWWLTRPTQAGTNACGDEPQRNRNGIWLRQRQLGPMLA